MSHKVTVNWKGGMLFHSDNPSGNTALMDTVTETQPKQQGLSPKAMMLSSLAGCSGIDVVDILKKKRAEYDDFKIEITGELTQEHPKYYNKVIANYHFYGSNLDEKKINRAVELSVEKYCGVMEMFRQFAEVETHIFLHQN